MSNEINNLRDQRHDLDFIPKDAYEIYFSEKNPGFYFFRIKSESNQSSLYYLHPKQNGYTLNWDVQRTIYEHLFYDTVNL